MGERTHPGDVAGFDGHSACDSSDCHHEITLAVGVLWLSDHIERLALRRSKTR